MSDHLFIGNYPGGMVYADRRREEGGDYKRVAFLPWDTLVLRIDAPRSDLIPEVKAHAATYQARRGDLHALSTTAERDASGRLLGCGQTIRLGGNP